MYRICNRIVLNSVGTGKTIIRCAERSFTGTAWKCATFYDSQSGTHITTPGSQGLRLHDCLFKCKTKSMSQSLSELTENGTSDKQIIEHFRAACAFKNISSVSLPRIANDSELQQYLKSSINYLQRNRAKLPFSIVAQLSTQKQLEILLESSNGADGICEGEVDIFVSKGLKLTESNEGILIKAASSKLKTRANLYFDLDSIVNVAGESVSKNFVPVLEAGEILAGLCDYGVKVINIGLYTSKAAENVAGRQ